MFYFSISLFHLRVNRLIGLYNQVSICGKIYVRNLFINKCILKNFPEPYSARRCKIYYITIEVNRFYFKD